MGDPGNKAQKGDRDEYPELSRLVRRDVDLEHGGKARQPRGVSHHVDVPPWDRMKAGILREFPEVDARDVEGLYGRLDELAMVIADRGKRNEGRVRARLHEMAREARP